MYRKPMEKQRRFLTFLLRWKRSVWSSGTERGGKEHFDEYADASNSPDEGRILWDGRYKKTWKPISGSARLYAAAAVHVSELYSGRISGLYGGIARAEKGTERCQDEGMLAILDLEEKRGQKIRSLSGGMKQRLLLMQALLHHPRILILDEPTAGLDPGQRIQVRNLIMELAMDCTVLLATHVVQDVELIAKRILLMKRGGLIADGNYRELCHMLDGKVYEMCISRKELRKYTEQFCVSSVREDLQGNYRIRFLSEQPLLRGGVCRWRRIWKMYPCFSWTGGKARMSLLLNEWKKIYKNKGFLTLILALFACNTLFAFWVIDYESENGYSIRQEAELLQEVEQTGGDYVTRHLEEKEADVRENSKV